MTQQEAESITAAIRRIVDTGPEPYETLRKDVDGELVKALLVAFPELDKQLSDSIELASSTNFGRQK